MNRKRNAPPERLPTASGELENGVIDQLQTHNTIPRNSVNRQPLRVETKWGTSQSPSPQFRRLVSILLSEDLDTGGEENANS
jgi:hypothetical protein